MTATVTIWLKGWRNGRLFADAVNSTDHAMHEAAWAVHQRSFDPWAEGDPVYFAIRYEMPETMTDLAICDDAFERFNIGDPASDDLVAIYRGRELRSLSVGDVVQVKRPDYDSAATYGCGRFGWDKLERFSPPRTARPS